MQCLFPPDNFTFSTDTVQFLCAKKVLEKLYDNLMFLPEPFKYALICLDAHIVNYMPEILPAEGSFCIQVVEIIFLLLYAPCAIATTI